MSNTCGIPHISVRRTLASHWIDGVIVGLVWGAAALCHWVYAPRPFDRFFVERDPALSHPWEKGFEHGEEVPTELVVVLAVPVTMFCLFILQLIAKKLFALTPIQKLDLHPKALNVFVLQLAFVESMGMTILATEFFKPFAGRKRPNFFALCNYKGYREAVTTNNFTEYFNNTVAGMPGNISYCQGTQAEILESQFSFPSGHASTIWCGMTFVGYFLMYIMHHYSPKNNMAKGLTALAFISTAALVSVTRPRDYWHNFDDILAGAVIGFACSTFGFGLNYSPVVTTMYKKGIPLDIDEASILMNNATGTESSSSSPSYSQV